MVLAVRRLVAYWIDFVLLASVLIGIQLLIYNVTSGFPFDFLKRGYEIEGWVLLTMSLPVWIYFIWCEVFMDRTIGKKIFRLKVTDEKGSRMKFTQGLTRTAVKLLPWELTHIIILIPDPWWSVEEPVKQALIYIPNAIMILYIIMLLLNRGEKGIHDVAARTRVSDVRLY